MTGAKSVVLPVGEPLLLLTLPLAAPGRRVRRGEAEGVWRVDGSLGHANWFSQSVITMQLWQLFESVNVSLCCVDLFCRTSLLPQ